MQLFRAKIRTLISQNRRHISTMAASITDSNLILDGKKDVFGGITVDMSQYEDYRIVPSDLFEMMKQNHQHSSESQERDYSFQSVLQGRFNKETKNDACISFIHSYIYIYTFIQ